MAVKKKIVRKAAPKKKLHSRTIEDFLKSMDELRESQKQAHEDFRDELRESQKQTTKKIEAFLKSMEALREAQKNMSKELGGMNRTDGLLAEHFFYDALVLKRKLGGVKYEQIVRNTKLKEDDVIKGEVDIYLKNDRKKVLAIIEVKQKMQTEYIGSLLGKKEIFLSIYPQYEKYKIYLYLAGFVFPEEVIKTAHSNGIGILKRKGETIEVLPKTAK